MSRKSSLSKNPPNKNLTFAVLKFTDSFLCLREEYLERFLTGSNNESVSPLVIWNDGTGICRLVPFIHLRTACRRLQPSVSFLSYRNEDSILTSLFREIFPNELDILRTNTIIGALDSYSINSSILERRLIITHKLNVPSDMYREAIRKSVEIQMNKLNKVRSNNDPMQMD